MNPPVNPAFGPHLPGSPAALAGHIQDRLFHQPANNFDFNMNGDLGRVSAVLFLLGTDRRGMPFLILNKRSRHVSQSGDLCCPGGGIAPAIDFALARWLRLPATPLTRWPHGTWWRRNRATDFSKLTLLLAAALREGAEEMRLNPLGVRFLGPMPPQHLVMFRRAIFPLVGWVNHQQRFFPNREVEKIVRIPLTAFFDLANYARYRISFKAGTPAATPMRDRDMPCLVHRQDGQVELLWGATFRITAWFFENVFDLVTPPMESLPVIHRHLDRDYLAGRPSS